MDEKSAYFKDYLVELLQGGFAPVVTLLKEFHYEKAGYVLDGLPFSAYGLLEHLKYRQTVLLHFMDDPENNQDVWPEAYWPKNMNPETKEDWETSILHLEGQLDKMIKIVKSKDVDLHKVYGNGKSVAWAAMTAFHHNAYHIGQIKAIGRQLGVW
ncbi:hypothetical protein RCC89_15725 [Cytophagaceae bacterium ABcell3]|nr:hypothetical protein RCC89_15725 [Cytophagaceae bacterium ABcell3]